MFSEQPENRLREYCREFVTYCATYYLLADPEGAEEGASLCARFMRFPALPLFSNYQVDIAVRTWVNWQVLPIEDLGKLAALLE
jgi:hypothetical protein